MEYTDSLTHYKRLITRPVKIGNLTVGNGEAIKVQSMTTTDTMDTEGTVEQVKRLVDVGCEIVRITSPSAKTSENLANIKNELIKQNYQVPLVADVHFNPNAALVAAEIVEKVRINPGNFVDRKKFEVFEYTDEEYQAEIKRIEDKFIPLLEICKKNQTTLRIGANHGSLSDRIVNKYGDSPTGMVASALEFLDICEKEDFDQLVFSMKSSNTLVMVSAYRLLAKKLRERGKIYPFHLGVTEAGDGEDGRIKSAVGIGSLLSDGIGDTLRVSLTEDPEYEIPVARKIAEYFSKISYQGTDLSYETIRKIYNPYEFKRYSSVARSNIGGGSVPKVFVGPTVNNIDAAKDLGFKYQAETDKWESLDIATDGILISEPSQLGETLSFLGTKVIVPFLKSNIENWQEVYANDRKTYPLFNLADYQVGQLPNDLLTSLDHYYLQLTSTDLADMKNLLAEGNELNSFLKKAVLVLQSETAHPAMEMKDLIVNLRGLNINNPVIYQYPTEVLLKEDSPESRQLSLALMTGPLLIDGLLDGVMLEQAGDKDVSSLFSLLQASRQRISRTEYISCPSCGRTLFNLQEVTAKVKARTNHLKGVKIAVMGCIVNGPGEMADADFGYVGAGPGKITLYKGKEVRVKSIPSENAVEALVDLIKAEGAWRDA